MKAENIARIKQARIDYEVAQTPAAQKVFAQIWTEIMADEIASGGNGTEIAADMWLACNDVLQGKQ